MNSEFWQRINSLIKAQKVTQEWVSKTADVKYQTFRNWSARDIIPDAIQAVRIAQALNTTVEYLVTGETSNPAEIELAELKKKLANLL